MSTTPRVVDTSKRVVLDYTSRDYKSIRSMLVGLASGLMPDWETVGETADFGTLLLELYAYTGDILNYYIDRVASEAFLGTAVRRQSVLYIADMFGYRPMGQRAATVPLTFSWKWDLNELTGGVIPVREHTVVSATATNGVATVGLTDDTYTIDLTPGQTISIDGVGSPFDGVFVVREVQAATTTSPLLVKYPIYANGIFTGTVTEESTASVGSIVKIPAGTVISSSPDASGQVYSFETDVDVVLDTARGVQASPSSGPSSSTIYTVSISTTATEGASVEPTPVGTSQGIPSAEFVIPDPGVIDRTIRVYTKEGGAVVPWAQVDKMSLASPTQSVYTVFVDDENYTHVLFGDGSSGRIPPTGAKIYVGYRYGSGAAANGLGVASLTTLGNDYAASTLGVTVSNTAPPVGGADVETVESMRYSIPRSNALKKRAVTLDDYVSLALQVPGLTRAVAYGANYSPVYVRVASGPASTGYAATPVTGYYVVHPTSPTDPALATVTLDNDYALVSGASFYIQNVASDVDGTVQPPTLWFKSTAAPAITDLTRVDTTVTITTEVTHNFKAGQPIAVNGTGGYDGTFVITSVTSPVEFTYEDSVSGAGSAATGTATAVPGFAFGVPSTATDTGSWTTPSGTTPLATTVDPTMDKLIAALEDYLSDKKLVGSVVYGEPVEWTNADVRCNAVVRPLYNRESVRSAVQRAIEGVFAYDNVDFGRRITVGDVYRAALAVDGVEYVTLTRLAETSDSQASVVLDINSSEDYVLTIQRQAMTEDGVVTFTASEPVNLRIGDAVRVRGLPPFNGTRYVTSIPTATTFTFSFNPDDYEGTLPLADTAINQPYPTATRNDSDNAYRIPRLNPNLGTTWVTATGGLVNT